MKSKLLIVCLILTVAVLCGSGWAGAQRASATQIFGGQGGNAFADPEPPPGTRVVEVQVRSGDHVDAVQFIYMLNDGRTVMGTQHGGGGGGLSVFHLDADEYLIGISGRSGSYIDSIQFQTNKRNSPTFGGRGGDRDFRVDVPANTQVTGFAGRAGEYLDAVGVTFTPMRREFSGGAGKGPKPAQTSIAGGSGGTEFVDGDIPAGATIVEVHVRGGDVVDSIQLIYSLPDGRPFSAARHGGGGGRDASFRLEPGEYIVGISGRCGTYVDSLRIQTNRRTSQLFGGRGGDRDYRLDIPDGSQATGFMGRSGGFLDAVGLTYAQMVPQDRFRDRRGKR